MKNCNYGAGKSEIKPIGKEPTKAGKKKSAPKKRG